MTDLAAASPDSPAPTTGPTVDPAWVAARHAAVAADPGARVAGNAVAAADVETLSLDRRVLTSIDTSVSDLIPDAAITNQRRSGRCWAFAGLNVLRARVIKELGLETLELSQSFVYFHDKLEKANVFLAQVVRDADRPIDEREVNAAFLEPIGDGGYWQEFAHLVSKYGMVPSYAMPDAFSATSSDSMNEHLATVLRRAGLALRAAARAGQDTTALHTAAMEDVHRVLTIHLGEPPASFTWQYRDKDKVFHREGTMTPLEFAARYAADVEDFTVLAHDPRRGTVLHQRYGVDRTALMAGQDVQVHVATTPEAMRAAAVRSIQAGVPVWFACDVAQQREKSLGVWDARLHDYAGLYGVELSMTKEERLVSHESELNHAMCLTGVDLVDGAPRRWRVENSWGDDLGEKGFHTMSDSWFGEYVFQVVVPTALLGEEDRAALGTDVVMLPSWDPMG